MLPLKNEEPLSQNITTAVLRYRQKLITIFWFYRFRKVVTAEKWTTAYRQKTTADKIPPYFGFTASVKKYRQKWENHQPPEVTAVWLYRAPPVSTYKPVTDDHRGKYGRAKRKRK